MLVNQRRGPDAGGRGGGGGEKKPPTGVPYTPIRRCLAGCRGHLLMSACKVGMSLGLDIIQMGHRMGHYINAMLYILYVINGEVVFHFVHHATARRLSNVKRLGMAVCMCNKDNVYLLHIISDRFRHQLKPHPFGHKLCKNQKDKKSQSD